MSEVKVIIGGVEISMPKETISEAIEKGQITIENPDLKVFKKEDFETYLKNAKKEDYENGKVVGHEVAVKTAREKYGLEFEGKNIENFAEALKRKTLEEAKIEPSKKIQEIEADKNKILENYTKLQSEFEGFKGQIAAKEKETTIFNSIVKSLPVEGLAIPAEEVALLLKSKLDFDIQENKVVTKKDGQILKNQTTLNPLGLNEVIPQYIEPYLIKRSGGHGGGDNGEGGKAGTLEAFMKEMEGKPAHELNAEMQKRIKAGTLKI